MANKVVAPVDIALYIKGAEKVPQLKGLFRDLSKTFKTTDKDIESVVEGINDYARSANKSEAVIKGQIKAFEGLREQARRGGSLYSSLSKDINRLQSDLRGSSDAVEKKRQSLVQLGVASKNSAKDLRVIIGQLEKLKSQVRKDSVAFAELGKDIGRLNAALSEIQQSAGKARFAVNTILSVKPEKITGQIEKLSATIAGGKLNAEDLNAALRKLEMLRVGAGRSAAVFRADTFASDLGIDYLNRLRKGYGDLEKTQAIISQRISEVNTELSNVTGYERRRSLTLELIRLNKELQSSIVNVTTSEQFQALAIRQRAGRARQANAASGFAAFSADIAARVSGGDLDPAVGKSIERRRRALREQAAPFNAAFVRAIEEGVAQTPLLLPAAGQTTAPGTGALMSGGVREFIPLAARLGGGEVGIPARPQPGDVQAISARRSMGPAATPEQLDASRRAYISETEATRVNAEAKEAAARVEANYLAEIDKATKANNGSLRSSNRLRSALDEYRSTLPVASKEFANLTKQINRLDSRSEAVSRRMGRRRMSPMQMTQAAGAAISGGIFGGPEGFIGGVGGGLLGGVGGAFAGAAFGAQVGGLRQTLGEFASYAAQIEKLNIALEGITGSQDQYNRALAAAANVTKSLNVPQEVAIQGITRLTAAVKGAGGGVADAELAFKNINAAIIATGGGSEQVQGAVTALVQIFSKGKVSAEEINQIAERLPGTFNKIAAASGRTGPELTKALQKGQVGLNDLMKFLISLGDEYGELAKKIAGSSENAGARLQVAFNKMRIEVGKALQPIGAEFQDIFKAFIEEITPTLVKVLPKIGEAFLAIAKNIDTVAVAIAGAMAVFAVGKISAIIASIGSLSAAIFTLKSNAITAAKALVGLNGAALLNPYTALAAGAALLATNVYNAARNQKALNGLIREGTVAEIDAELAKLDKRRAEVEKRILKRGDLGSKSTEYSEISDTSDVDLVELRRIMDASKQLRNRRQAALKDSTQGASVDLSQLKVFADPKPDGADTTKGIKDISKLEADLIIARTKLNEEDLLARKEFIRAEAEIARQLADAEPFHKRRAALAQIAQKEAEALARVDEEMKKGAEQMVKDLADQRKERKRIDDELKHSLAARKLELGLITQEEFNQLEIARERARLQELQRGGFISAEGVEEQMNVFKQLLNQTPIDKFVKQAKDSLNDLQTVAVNVAQGIGDAVGNALTNGIASLVEGTKNAKEVFADFLKSVGQMLVQEGARMIATYIAIGVARAFAGMSAGGGGTEAASKAGSQINVAPSASSFQGGTDFAVPSHFKQYPTLAGRAGGGPVNAGRPYMVGERGPELFVPGQSGGIMRNEEMRRLMGRSPASAGSQPSMNFTFETTNIGGTEYVSREQLEAAMATTRRQAANDGARRGMSMTLDKMQNSPRTRSRIGIS